MRMRILVGRGGGRGGGKRVVREQEVGYYPVGEVGTECFEGLERGFFYRLFPVVSKLFSLD